MIGFLVVSPLIALSACLCLSRFLMDKWIQDL